MILESDLLRVGLGMFRNVLKSYFLPVGPAAGAFFSEKSYFFRNCGRVTFAKSYF